MENRELIQRAVLYSKENFGDNGISARKIAAYAGFSMDYFNKLFLIHTGFTVMSYVGYIRVKNAALLLRMSDDTVLDIALKVGYDSHEGFIKAFKKIYGVTPAEYRKNNRERAVCYGDLADSSCIHRFLRENPDFALLDSDEVIDALLEADARKYGYFCTMIKPMGLWLVAPNGDYGHGFIAVGDDRHGGIWLEAVSDDMPLLAEWLKRFSELEAFYTDIAPENVNRALRENGLDISPESTPESLYFGGKIKSSLPDGITVRELTYDDRDSITEWANGRCDGYVRHLLTEAHYSDPSVLEYGVFRDREMIAAVGCGIEECRGFALNNCVKIMFGESREEKALYRPIFEYVVDDILEKGILPFDDIQHGSYAEDHGGFTAEEVGFECFCRRYEVK